jgi:hypothetical protein
MQITNKADCSVLRWKVLHSNAPLGVLPILAFVLFLLWWRNSQLHVMCLLIFVFCYCIGLVKNLMLSAFSSTILGAGEDGTIWRWDEVDHGSSKN